MPVRTELMRCQELVGSVNKLVHHMFLSNAHLRVPEAVYMWSGMELIKYITIKASVVA